MCTFYYVYHSHDARVMPRSAPVTPRPQHADVSSEGGGGGPSPASSSSNLPPYLQQLRQDGGVVPGKHFFFLS